MCSAFQAMWRVQLPPLFRVRLRGAVWVRECIVCPIDTVLPGSGILRFVAPSGSRSAFLCQLHHGFHKPSNLDASKYNRPCCTCGWCHGRSLSAASHKAPPPDFPSNRFWSAFLNLGLDELPLVLEMGETLLLGCVIEERAQHCPSKGEVLIALKAGFVMCKNT